MSKKENDFKTEDMIGLLHELQTNFKSLYSVKRYEKIMLDVDKKQIKNFKIFALLDTDDCSEEVKK